MSALRSIYRAIIRKRRIERDNAARTEGGVHTSIVIVNGEPVVVNDAYYKQWEQP